MKEFAQVPKSASGLDLHSTLLPHFENLSRVISTDDLSRWALAAALSHAKTEELSFWVYCEVLAHFQSKENFIAALRRLLATKSIPLQTRIEELEISDQFDFAGFLEQLHRSKLTVMLPAAKYSKFIVLLLTAKTSTYCSNVVFCYLLYLKRPLLKTFNKGFAELVNDYMKSVDIDW